MAQRKKRGPDVRLAVNGRTVPLNPFVSGFLRKTLIGMVSSLRGVKRVKTLSLRLSETTRKK